MDDDNLKCIGISLESLNLSKSCHTLYLARLKPPHMTIMYQQYTVINNKIWEWKRDLLLSDESGDACDVDSDNQTAHFHYCKNVHPVANHLFEFGARG